MSQAERTSTRRAAISGFPRIDRYFPECRIAALEADARFLFGVEDFGKLYGRHTFRYSKPPGPITFRSNGVELDLEIHREPLPRTEPTALRTELDSLMESIYGIRNELVSFVDFDEYRLFCIDSIAAGAPVVTNFDLGFIRQRREYKKLQSPHVIVLFGYDTESRQVKAGEQMLGEISVDFEDFERCFAHRVATDGAMWVWMVERCRPSERALSRTEAAARIEANLSNMTATDGNLGLTALTRFRADLTGYLESDAFRGKPFAIPGLWVFSHERHIQRKWLKALGGLCSDATALGELDEILGRLFKRWLGADYLIEKCLMSGDGRALRGLPSYLNEIVDDEHRAMESWRRIGTLV